jgi:chemotaxis protein MotB
MGPPEEAAPLPESSYNREETSNQSLLSWVLVGVMIALLGGLLYVGVPLLRDERASAEAARKESSQALARATDAEAARRALEGRLRTLEEEKLALSADRDALSVELRQKDTELAELKATYDSLEDQMQAEIKKGEIRVSQQAGGKVRVDLVDKVLFASGDAALSPRGEEILGRIASALTRVDDKQIQVSGHTDDSPISKNLQDTYPSNWELSTARAVNVVRYLSEKAQVPARRLMASGYGPHQPVSSNSDASGRARNRRIEILLTPLTTTSSSKVVAKATEEVPAKNTSSSTKPAKGARRSKR